MQQESIFALKCACYFSNINFLKILIGDLQLLHELIIVLSYDSSLLRIMTSIKFSSVLCILSILDFDINCLTLYMWQLH